MITITHKGNFDKTNNFFKKCLSRDYSKMLDRYAREGVEALANATPVDSGATSDSWGYEIENTGNTIRISWTNSNLVDGIPVAILIQYGHATGNGGYVQGLDYINPVIRPLFDRIANEIWRAVTQ
jgi:hypothetical protein